MREEGGGSPLLLYDDVDDDESRAQFRLCCATREEGVECVERRVAEWGQKSGGGVGLGADTTRRRRPDLTC
jgi:hypothetical protein